MSLVYQVLIFKFSGDSLAEKPMGDLALLAQWTLCIIHFCGGSGKTIWEMTLKKTLRIAYLKFVDLCYLSTPRDPALKPPTTLRPVT